MVKPLCSSMRPRYLRAIPSLVVLTTAMAWGVASEPDVPDMATRRASVALVQAVAAGRWPDTAPFFIPEKPFAVANTGTMRY